MKLLKTATGKHNSKLKFYTSFLIESKHVIVIDDSCQMERTYYIGCIMELDNFEEMEIKSINQVITAWSTGKIWF